MLDALLDELHARSNERPPLRHFHLRRQTLDHGGELLVQLLEARDLGGGDLVLLVELLAESLGGFVDLARVLGDG